MPPRKTPKAKKRLAQFGITYVIKVEPENPQDAALAEDLRKMLALDWMHYIEDRKAFYQARGLNLDCSQLFVEQVPPKP